MKTELLVIGGGAAGLMAACTAAEQGMQVVLVDKNRKLGKKLRITGKGRCNLTNDCEVRDFLTHIGGEAKFLYPALSAFGPAETMAFFEENGLSLKTERGRRVFPQTDNANDVADLLVHLCRQHGVRILEDRAAGISIRDGAVTGVKTESGTVSCSACLISTGGLSYPLTGSTGDGYRFARSLGHTVSELRPSLVPLESPSPACRRLQGLTLKNVEFSLFRGESRLFRERGEMLFTHFGISGPLVLSASAQMRQNDLEPYRAEIDLKPALDEKSLDQRLLRDLQKYQNKTLPNALTDLLPRTLIPEVLERSGLAEELRANSLTKEERSALLRTLKAFPLKISGTRPYDEAIITAGGVNLKEINPRTMESRYVPGLYFAGEILNLDGVTGGFNLQIAWSTGRLAGISAAEKYHQQEE